jgi:2,3-dihydroxybenzoate-AMP ligase
MLGVFHAGGTLVIAKGADSTEVFTTIARERVTDRGRRCSPDHDVAQWPSRETVRRLVAAGRAERRGAAGCRNCATGFVDEVGCVPQEIYGTAEGLINMTRLTDSDDLLLESSERP